MAEAQAPYSPAIHSPEEAWEQILLPLIEEAQSGGGSVTATWRHMTDTGASLSTWPGTACRCTRTPAWPRCPS